MTNIEKRSINIDGYNLTYVEMGDPEGRPIVFQHGNPTSSYLWRNIMPHLEEGNRCIAIDLIGMGDSQKLPDDFPDRYSFDCHSQFFEKALAALNINKNIILVIHDWGSALGFDFAARNTSRVDGIAYMEAIVAPIESWDDWPENARGIFQAFRSEAGEEVILDKNVFVERVLPGSIIRALTTEEMDQYRKPFLNPGEDRRPTLTWPRQIPIEGSPPDVVARVQAYADFMQKSPMPKLFINADPGSILVGKMRDFCRSWPNQNEITVKGTHFIQEDSPNEIGTAIYEWLKREF